MIKTSKEKPGQIINAFALSVTIQILLRAKEIKGVLQLGQVLVALVLESFRACHLVFRHPFHERCWEHRSSIATDLAAPDRVSLQWRLQSSLQ